MILVQTAILVCLHADVEQEHHAPVPAVIKGPGDIELCTGPLEERGRGDEENKVHPYLVVLAPERPAVDKLPVLAEKVLLPYIKLTEDLNLRPIATISPFSAKLPFVFLLLEPSWRREASRITRSLDPYDFCPGNCQEKFHQESLLNQQKIYIEQIYSEK